MAPKRASPVAPVDSSAETASESSGYDSEDLTSPPSATTKNTALPPQMVQQPKFEEEEEEEEEEEVKPNQTAPPSATQNLRLKREESESDEEEEEDTDEGSQLEEAEGEGVKPAGGRSDMPANGIAPRDFGEICQTYPYLAEVIEELEKSHKGLFKRELYMIDDEKARTLDRKIKKQRLAQIKLEQRNQDTVRKVIKVLIDHM